MLTRICYALVMAWRYRKMLKAYRTESALQAAKVVILDPVLLKAEGIKVLVIDVDGVLTSFGELIVTKEIESWLNSCVSIMGEGRVVVLTNKPTTERSQYYANTFKGIQLVQARRKKPLVFAIRAAKIPVSNLSSIINTSSGFTLACSIICCKPSG